MSKRDYQEPDSPDTNAWLQSKIEGRVLDVLNYPDRHRHGDLNALSRCCDPMNMGGVSYKSIDEAHRKLGLWPPKRGK